MKCRGVVHIPNPPKSNPADDAAAMYESFHGTPSTGELVIEDKVHYHGNLAELGVLCGLKVRVVTGYDVTLQFGGGLNAQVGNPAKYRVSVFSKGTGFYGEGSKVFTSRGAARRYFKDIAQEGYKVALVSDDSKIEHVSGMTVKEAKVYAVPGQRLNKGKAGPGPLTKAYRFSTGIVPGLLEGADSALGRVVNPTPEVESAYRAAMLADESFHRAVEQEWGKKRAGDMRYRSKEFTPQIKALAKRKQEADEAYRVAVARMRHGNRRGNPDGDTGPVILCSNEAGNQLYFRGGDQALDLASIKMADFERDHMVIGEVWGLAYATKKEFDKFQEIEYVHILGLEKFHQRMAKSADLWEDALPPKDEAFGCGNLPVLNYDTLNKSLSVAGGVYKNDKPWSGVSPGIEN
jgi:hypothetical protein